jgi:hypothetical protein
MHEENANRRTNAAGPSTRLENSTPTLRDRIRSLPGFRWLRAVLTLGATYEQWARVVMNREARKLIRDLRPVPHKVLDGNFRRTVGRSKCSNTCSGLIARGKTCMRCSTKAGISSSRRRSFCEFIGTRRTVRAGRRQELNTCWRNAALLWTVFAPGHGETAPASAQTSPGGHSIVLCFIHCGTSQSSR